MSAAQAEILAQFWLAGQLAGRRVPNGADDPVAVLGDFRRAVAEILGRYDDKLDQDREVIRQ